MSLQSLQVDLGARSYPLWIGSGLLGAPERWQTALHGRHVLIVSNSTVAPLYLQRVQSTLHDRTVDTLILPDGESFKTLQQVERIFAALAAMGATRDACVIALGGGVVGDTAGFAAACWMRGIDVLQMPTTLLAMVDSSVGGKTGVNLPAGKNLVGAFHQPCAVLADVDTLQTLDARDYRAGLAEAVKHSALGDADFLHRLETLVEPLNRRDGDALSEVIAHSCAFKAGVVARDETERGERALLNFGHTFGHALETACGYGTLKHGEAVAIGMLQAAKLSARLGMADAADARRLETLLRHLGLPTAPPPADPDALLAHMRLDKKNRGGQLRLILWRGIGRAEIIDDVAEADVRQVLQPSA